MTEVANSDDIAAVKNKEWADRLRKIIVMSLFAPDADDAVPLGVVGTRVWSGINFQAEIQMLKQQLALEAMQHYNGPKIFPTAIYNFMYHWEGGYLEATGDAWWA